MNPENPHFEWIFEIHDPSVFLGKDPKKVHLTTCNRHFENDHAARTMHASFILPRQLIQL